MRFDLKPGQGLLFKNEKGDNPSRPDRRGQINIGGQFYDIAGWVKTGKKGQFLSLAVSVNKDTATRKRRHQYHTTRR